jgi:hypothetical protein
MVGAGLVLYKVVKLSFKESKRLHHLTLPLAVSERSFCPTASKHVVMVG